jgi:glutathione S-transferase
MKLYMSGGSPYSRKVLVVAMERGLADRIERVVVALSPVKAHADLAAVNPLMKIPALVTDENEHLFDSRVICEYLDSLPGGRRLIPEAAPLRWQVLRQQALADGLLDAAVACRFEAALRPPEKQWAPWTEGQALKATQALDQLQDDPLLYAPDLHLGQIAVACAVDWLEFRKPIGDIRTGRERLFEWVDRFLRRDAMQATRPT